MCEGCATLALTLALTLTLTLTITLTLTLTGAYLWPQGLHASHGPRHEHDSLAPPHDGAVRQAVVAVRSLEVERHRWVQPHHLPD